MGGTQRDFAFFAVKFNFFERNLLKSFVVWKLCAAEL